MPTTTGGWRVVYARVPPELRKRLRVRAAAEDRPISDVARDALARYLDDEERSNG